MCIEKKKKNECWSWREVSEKSKSKWCYECLQLVYVITNFHFPLLLLLLGCAVAVSSFYSHFHLFFLSLNMKYFDLNYIIYFIFFLTHLLTIHYFLAESFESCLNVVFFSNFMQKCAKKGKQWSIDRSR